MNEISFFVWWIVRTELIPITWNPKLYHTIDNQQSNNHLEMIRSNVNGWISLFQQFFDQCNNALAHCMYVSVWKRRTIEQFKSYYIQRWMVNVRSFIGRCITAKWMKKQNCEITMRMGQMYVRTKHIEYGAKRFFFLSFYRSFLPLFVLPLVSLEICKVPKV